MKKNKLLLLIPFILGTVAITGCDSFDIINKDENDTDGSSEDSNSTIKETFTDDSIKAYYNSITISKENANLKNSLNSLIKSHTTLSYKNLWTAYQTTDTTSEGKIYCIYTGLTFNYGTTNGGQQDQGSGGQVEGEYYNREHTSPQSWFGNSGPEFTDLFNVYPTDKYINGQRGNMDFGEVGNATITSKNGSKIGVSKRSDNVATVFEIADEYKGDMARSYFYMATCYMNSTSWYGNCDSKIYSVSSTGIDLSQHGIDLLLKWAHNDPVSEKEIARNNAVYALQGNRNPFIDYENLETYIWTPSANYLDM